MTPDDRKPQFLVIKGLLGAGKLLVAGPRLDEAMGIVILETEDEEEARRLVTADPAVRSGVFLADLHPYHVSLIAKR